MADFDPIVTASDHDRLEPRDLPVPGMPSSGFVALGGEGRPGRGLPNMRVVVGELPGPPLRGS